MASEAERQAVREFLSGRIMEAAERALKESPDFRLALLAIPQVLAGLAGATLLQLVRTRIIGDGESDNALEAMTISMHQHANPALNPPTGNEPELTAEERAFYRHGRIPE